MRLLLRLSVAFCVATVLAQGLILFLAGIRGNLKRETMFQAIALINGVDIGGERLAKILSDHGETPTPTHEDVEAERARQNMTLDMRERSILQYKRQVEELLNEHRETIAAYDRRKNEFYNFLETAEKDLLNESLKEVQRTLEALSAEQAKDQLKKLLEAEQMDDVVAIVKGMPLDKRRKVLGEFTTDEEIAQLNEILMTLRKGDPKASLINKARNQSAIQ